MFEVGSIICAAAPRITVLILGRAVAGLGAAGIFVSVLSIIAEVTRLEQRPKLLGALVQFECRASLILILPDRTLRRRLRR